MHIGKGYTLAEFLDWTRRRIYLLAVLAAVPVVLYQGLGQKWIAIPWVVVALLGTAASFIVGFKNSQTYGRTLEAQQVWTAIAAGSRYWGLIARDFPNDRSKARALVYRHLAWLTALRYQLRRQRVWETAASAPNSEYQEKKAFTIPERETSLDAELRKYLPDEELARLAGTWDKATRILGEQSAQIRALFTAQELVVLHHTEMQKTLKEFIDQQSRAERIKNFPYPRQYAVINRIFVWTFAALLPFGLVAEFDRLNDVSLDQVGESTENPFEGAANDVPIAQVCRLLEIELRDMLGETELPRLLQPQGNVIL